LKRLAWRIVAAGCTAVAFCLLLATICLAQVLQSGTVSPGHAAMWSTSGVIMDAGATSFPTKPNTRLSGLGIINAGSTDCRWNTYGSPYAQFCLGFDAQGNGLLSYQNIGGPPTGTINYSINGGTGTFGGASPIGTPGTVVDVRQYAVAGGGVIKTDGEIGAGSSTGTCDLYSVSYNFGAAFPTPVGQYAVVFDAGAAGATLVGGKITAVSGNHATLTNCASTTIASGATFAVAPDDCSGITAAMNNLQGYAVHFPTGVYGTTCQITVTRTKVRAGSDTTNTIASAFGDGPGATYIIALEPMTTATTNEAVFYRDNLFASGGGMQGMTVDAAGLADEAISVNAGTHALYQDVWGKNAVFSDWVCDTTGNAQDILWNFIRGDSDPALFTAAQEPSYDWEANVTNSGCTGNTIQNSIFENASVANVYDGTGGTHNSFLKDHEFNAANYAPPWMMKTLGDDIFIDNQLDAGAQQPGGGNPGGIDIDGPNVTAIGNFAFFNTPGYVSGSVIQIENNKANVTVLGTATRAADSVTAADIVLQVGSAGANNCVGYNPGASYKVAC
jgi:hypothetical protein